MPLIYGIILAVMSLVTFCTYAADKIKAKNGAWRIPEKVLLLLSFFGGGIGGYLAMQLVRHKTRHWYFHVVNIIGVIWQVALLIWLLVL